MSSASPTESGPLGPLVRSCRETVSGQLGHAPGTLRAHSLRDDWCVGYVMGTMFHGLGLARVDPTAALAEEAFGDVFRRLYGEDGPDVLAHAAKLASIKGHRFMAGFAGGFKDAKLAAQTGAPGRRLAQEFSLLRSPRRGEPLEPRRAASTEAK